MDKAKFSFWKSILKGATYTAVGIGGAVIVQSIQSGVDLKQAAVLGVATGLIALVKNIVKHGFGMDIDFTKLV